MNIIDISPTRQNTNADDTNHSVTGRMFSIACSPDGKELYTGSWGNIWTSSDGGRKWQQLTWPQPDPGQFSVPGAITGWSVVDLAVINGWRVEKHPRMLARLTHSGFTDIVGFGECGMWVAPGNGDGTFRNPVVVNSEFGLLAGGWQVDKHPRFLADLNNDGLADVIGFGFDGVWTAIGNGNGTFRAPGFVLNDLGFNQGWRIDRHPRFVLDVDGDGRTDIIGFGDEFVWVATGDGAGGFLQLRPVHQNFCYNQGWRVERHPRFVADMNRDRRADIIAFHDTGVWLAFQQPDGGFTEPSQPVLANFGTNQGWHVDQHPRFVVDLDNDGFPDIIGFGNDGAWAAINDRNGGFKTPVFTPGLFGFNQGWRVDKHPRIVIDLNGDGIADIVGFGDDGIWTAIGKGDGTFHDAQFVHQNLGFNQGWRVDRHPRFAADLGHGRIGVIGFGDAGVWSDMGDGHGGFPSSNFVLANFGYGSILLAMVANDTAQGARGIWRSTDWGTNWSKVHQFATPRNVGELCWAPGSDHLVYAAGGSSLAISKDAGATFQDVFPWGSGQAAHVNHVAVWQNEAADLFPSIIYALGDSTMFVSFDGGAHWIRDKGPLPPNIGGATSQEALFTAAHPMAVSPRCPLQVIVAQNGSSAPQPAMLYRGDYTRFMGAQTSNWAPLSLPNAIVDPKDRQDSGNTFLVATQRGRGDLLFFGAQRFSDANAATSSIWVGPLEPSSPSDWHRLGGVHADLHGFLLSPDFRAEIRGSSYQPGAGRMWVLSDGGLYRSNDGGLTMSPADNLETLSCLSVAGVAIPGKGVALSLNTGDNDGFYSMNGGQNWSYQQYGGGDNDCSFADPLRPHAMMVFTPRWNTAGVQQDPGATRHGQTVSVYQTSPGNLPNAASGTGDRKAVTGPPTVPDDQPFREIWNAGSGFALRGFRPIVLGLTGETAPAQGDYIFVLNPSDPHPVLVRTQNIFDIKHREEWLTSATGPGQGANVFLQGPPLPESRLGVVQAAGGHANPIYFAGGNGNLWKWTAGMPQWARIVPALPVTGKSVGANNARRFFVHPYLPGVIYLLDDDHVKRSDDGGQTWLVDQPLETQLTWNHPISLSAGGLDFTDIVLADMNFDPNFFAARFAIGIGGAFMTIDGVNWTQILHSAALPARPSSCYLDSMSAATATLYVAMSGRSIVRIPNLLLSVIF